MTTRQQRTQHTEDNTERTLIGYNMQSTQHNKDTLQIGHKTYRTKSTNETHSLLDG